MALHFEDYQALPIGFRWTTAPRRVTQADIVQFAALTGDDHPQHVDAEYGRASPYGACIAHGFLTASLAAGQVYRLGLDIGTSHAFLSTTWKFAAPVLAGDSIAVLATLTSCRASRSHPAMGIIGRHYEVTNQQGAVVAVADVALMIKRRCG